MGYGRSGDKKPRGASRRSRTRPEAPKGPWGPGASRGPGAPELEPWGVRILEFEGFKLWDPRGAQEVPRGP